MPSDPHPLDSAATWLLQMLAYSEQCPGARARAAVDAAVRDLHRLLRIRLRMLIRHHGLEDHAEDAEQACLIAMVDAVRRWDPERSGFGTWLGWQWRSALAAFSRRTLGDSRTAAGRRQRALAVTDDDALAALADPLAELAAMRGAANWLAELYADRLLRGGDHADAGMVLDGRRRRRIAELRRVVRH